MHHSALYNDTWSDTPASRRAESINCRPRLRPSDGSRLQHLHRSLQNAAQVAANAVTAAHLQHSFSESARLAGGRAADLAPQPMPLLGSMQP